MENLSFNAIVFFVDLILVVLMSLITFVFFFVDKKKAENGSMRIKEKTLLGLTVLNGAFGAFIGRLVAHHKTNKIYFSMTIYFGMLCQAAVLVFLALLAFVL